MAYSVHSLPPIQPGIGPDVDDFDNLQLASDYVEPSIHARNAESIVNWLAFPCFAGSEILYKRETSAINAQQFFAAARGRFAAIMIEKIGASILGIILLVPATLVNLVVIAVFKIIALGSKYSQDRTDLNIAASETWQMTKEYWSHGLPLLAGRVFSHLPMNHELMIRDKLDANLKTLGYPVF